MGIDGYQWRNSQFYFQEKDLLKLCQRAVENVHPRVYTATEMKR